MTDYEWVMGRGARTIDWTGRGVLRRTNHSLEEFAALEYPKESPAWLLGTAEQARAPSSAALSAAVATSAGKPR